MRLVHNIEFIWTLEELVGLGTHGVFRNENKILGAQSFLGSNHQRPSAPLVVRCHGKDTQNAVNLLLREIVLQKEVLRVRPHDVLRTGAHSQPFNFHPYQMPYAVLCCSGHTQKGIELLRMFLGHWSSLGHWEVGTNTHLRTHGALSLHHPLSHASGQGLDIRKRLRSQFLRKAFHYLTEPGHVHAGLLRIQVDEQVQGSVEELRLASVRYADNPAQVLHPCPAQCRGYQRSTLLDVPRNLGSCFSFHLGLLLTSPYYTRPSCTRHHGLLNCSPNLGDGAYVSHPQPIRSAWRKESASME